MREQRRALVAKACVAGGSVATDAGGAGSMPSRLAMSLCVAGSAMVTGQVPNGRGGDTSPAAEQAMKPECVGGGSGLSLLDTACLRDGQRPDGTSC